MIQTETEDINNTAPDELGQAMQSLVKEHNNTIYKILDELTPVQSKKFASIYAMQELNNRTDIETAMKKAVENLDLDDDRKAQVADVIADTDKAFAGYKAAAVDVKDFSDAVALVDEINQTTQDDWRNLRDVLGPTDTLIVIKSVAVIQKKQNGSANSTTVPTTQPAK